MNALRRFSRAYTLVEIMIVVVMLALIMSIAIPALQKARSSSQDRAVLNNARRLAEAADQFYLENGTTTVALTDLVGSERFVKALTTVAGETYPANYTHGITITVSGVAGTRTLTYAP